LLEIIENREGSPVSMTQYIQGSPCAALILNAKPATTGNTPSVFE